MNIFFKQFLAFSFFLVLSGLYSNSYGKGKYFVSKQFVHLHKNESINSVVLLTLSCGQQVEVEKDNNEWFYVSTGSFKGFVLSRNFSGNSPECFSQNFSKLYNKIDLDMREIYKLGRLEDLFIYGEPEL